MQSNDLCNNATPNRFAVCLFAASAFIGLHGTSHADDDRKVQVAPQTLQAAATGKRLSTGEIVTKLESAGYTHITEIEFDDGHYEVEARNKQGQRVELDVHAHAGEVLHTEIED